MCLGGHLAFRAAFDKRISAAVCYFATGMMISFPLKYLPSYMMGGFIHRVFCI